MLDSEKEIHNVALYTRVSTDEQARTGYSLDAQLDHLKDYARARDWVIVGEYVDDGYTGRNIKRPAYTKMFEDIGKWDAVVVIKMDRIHRNQTNFTGMIRFLMKNEKSFISMQDSFDTSTAMGRFVADIVARIAQLESEQIGERVSVAFVQKAKSDKSGFMNHRPPFGYRWDPDLKKHIEVPGEIKKVRDIYKMYLGGMSFREIQAKTGIRNSSISYYLHNSFYTGIERWCNFFRKSNLQPIITIPEFNQVQRKFKENSHGITANKYEKELSPLQIKNESFKINRETEKSIPIIQRGKHNWQRAW